MLLLGICLSIRLGEQNNFGHYHNTLNTFLGLYRTSVRHTSVELSNHLCFKMLKIDNYIPGSPSYSFNNPVIVHLDGRGNCHTCPGNL